MWARALVVWESEEDIDTRLLLCASWTAIILSGAKYLENAGAERRWRWPRGRWTGLSY